MKFRQLSLQVQLVAMMLGAVSLFGLLAGYESYRNALHEADEMFDAQLAQLSQTLLAVASRADEGEDGIQELGPLAHKYQRAMAFQVWTSVNGAPRLLLHSRNAPAALAGPLPPEGFSEGCSNGDRWRYYRQHDPRRGLDVVVGQTDKARSELAGEVAWHNLAPFLFGLPLLALAALAAIRFGLYPLRKLAHELGLRSPERLDPISLDNTPKEIAPVVDALDLLLHRVAAALENERRFTSDAAHELRTPIAALRSQVQAALLAGEAQEWRESLAKALRGADRMTHLVEQMLTLSRLDALSSAPHLEPVDLARVVRESCAEQGSAAIARKIELELNGDESAWIPGSADFLAILARNLLDNAIRYTPEQGRVSISIHRRDEAVQLEVADSGPGVPDEQLARLGRRFDRLGPSSAEGAGLGISIIQRIAEIHGASISFTRTSETGGLKATVVFPAAPRPKNMATNG